MTLGPVRVMGAGVVVMMCVVEVRCNSCSCINVNAFCIKDHFTRSKHF